MPNYSSADGGGEKTTRGKMLGYGRRYIDDYDCSPLSNPELSYFVPDLINNDKSMSFQ